MQCDIISDIWEQDYAEQLKEALHSMKAKKNASISLDVSHVERVSFACVQVLIAWVCAQKNTINLVASPTVHKALVDVGGEHILLEKGKIECR